MTRSLSLIDLQIMWNRLIAVVEEQGQILMRTAFSPIVRECGDISAGVFDLSGRMLAQGVTGTPGHVNAMAESVGRINPPQPEVPERSGGLGGLQKTRSLLSPPSLRPRRGRSSG